MAEKAHTSSEGWVYLIVNDQTPLHVKIGKSDRDPIERARELVSTGTVGTFVVIYQAWVRDPYAVEQRVHRTLERHRKSGEWFEVCPNVAKHAIHQAADEVQFEKVMPRWHPSQREPAPWTRVFLEEARLAAEEAAERQRQAEEAAIRAAEEAAAKRRAEEKARADAEAAAAKAAAKEQAARERLEAMRRRRCDKKVTRIAWGAVGLVVTALAVYAVLGPYAADEVARRQMHVEQAEGRHASLDRVVEVARAEVVRAKAKVAGAPEERTKWQGILERATAQAAKAERQIREKQASLKRQLKEQPDPQYADGLKPPLAEIRSARQILAEEESAADAARSVLAALPEEELLAKDQLALAVSAEKEAERELQTQKQVSIAAKRGLAEALRRNEWWTWLEFLTPR
jgi:hypothetical protein